MVSVLQQWARIDCIQEHAKIIFPLPYQGTVGSPSRLLCSAGIANENEFHTTSSPTLCASNDVTSGHAHSLCLETWLP